MIVERMFDRLVAMIYGVVRYSTVAENSADGTTDKVKGLPGNPDESATHEEARRFQTWGVRSRPPQGVEAIVVRVGGGATNGVQIAHESSRYGPSALNDGEAALYSKTNPTAVLATNDGVTTVESTDGNGALKAIVKLDASGNVIVNNGTLKVVRETDGVQIGTLGPATAGPYPVNFTFTPTIATGGETTGPGSPVSGSTVTLSGVIAPGGAANFKA